MKNIRVLMILLVAFALVAAACGDDDDSTTTTAAASGGETTTTAAASGGETVGVTLVLKTLTNPFFVSMADSAQAEADALGVSLTVAAGDIDGDTQSQINAIEAAVARGDAGILITPSGDAVIPALDAARAAGLYTIALDTPPNPPTAVRHHVCDRQLPCGSTHRSMGRRDACR